MLSRDPLVYVKNKLFHYSLIIVLNGLLKPEDVNTEANISCRMNVRLKFVL